MRELFRVFLWGLAAAASLTIAILAGSTSGGSDRAGHAALQIREIFVPSGIKPARPLDAIEGRQLAETVRMLSADRERLLARIAALEHSVDDVTGSIARVEKAARAAPATPPAALDPPASTSPPEITKASEPFAPPSAAPSTPPEPEITSSIAAPDVPPPTSESRSPVQHSQLNQVTRRQFGLDFGVYPSEAGVRAAWSAALRRHGALLESLHPVMATRERSRGGGVEYRLIAGPIANASKAARFCAAVTAMGGICQPTMFNGEKLAIR